MNEYTGSTVDYSMTALKLKTKQFYEALDDGLCIFWTLPSWRPGLVWAEVGLITQAFQLDYGFCPNQFDLLANMQILAKQKHIAH